ncbi:MAG: hypothetical protein ABR507_07760 [Actinomycetota bacterium]|nr:hypothetical protein [Actinomycetota bacterium]
MDDQHAIQALAAAREAIQERRTLNGTGYWPLVRAAKRQSFLAQRFGKQIAQIDKESFESAVRMRVPAAVGLVILSFGTTAGVGLLLVAGNWRSQMVRDLTFLAGFGALDVFTHSLAHWIVGRSVGIRFTHLFIGGPPPPRPGFKTDYETYLTSTPMRRAAMHASGAIVTKLIPFILIPTLDAVGTSRWMVWVLLAVGFGQILTDVLFSTKTSDWKKVKRELGSG